MIIIKKKKKNGVDIINLISSKLPVQIKSRTINTLVFILDIVRTNAKVILRESVKSNFTTFKFTWELGKQSVTPNKKIQQSHWNSKKDIRKMTKVLGEEAVAWYKKTMSEDQGKGCGTCFVESIGHENYNKMKNKLNNKIKTACYKCKHTVCAKDTVVFLSKVSWRKRIEK